MCIPNGCSLKIFSGIAKMLNVEEKLDQAEKVCITKETGKNFPIEATIILYGYISFLKISDYIFTFQYHHGNLVWISSNLYFL